MSCCVEAGGKLNKNLPSSPCVGAVQSRYSECLTKKRAGTNARNQAPTATPSQARNAPSYSANGARNANTAPTYRANMPARLNTSTARYATTYRANNGDRVMHYETANASKGCGNKNTWTQAQFDWCNGQHDMNAHVPCCSNENLWVSVQPEHVGGRTSTGSSTRTGTSTRKMVVHTGPQGGKFVMKGARKVYISTKKLTRRKRA
jgi:hypothetical protein